MQVSDITAYFINLDDSTERRMNTERQLDDLGIQHHRVVAITPHQSAYSEGLAKFAPHGPAAATSSDPVAAAVNLSFFKMLYSALSSSRPYVLLVEDDVRFEPNFMEKVRELVQIVGEFDSLHLSVGCVRKGELFTTDALVMGDPWPCYPLHSTIWGNLPMSQRTAELPIIPGEPISILIPRKQLSKYIYLVENFHMLNPWRPIDVMLGYVNRVCGLRALCCVNPQPIQNMEVASDTAKVKAELQ